MASTIHPSSFEHQQQQDQQQQQQIPPLASPSSHHPYYSQFYHHMQQQFQQHPAFTPPPSAFPWQQPAPSTNIAMPPSTANPSPSQAVPTIQRRLKNFAIYYGWPSCTNSATLKWDVTAIARFYSQYDFVVFGGDGPNGTVGLASPSHGDHANTKEILRLMAASGATTKVFGYITIGGGNAGHGPHFSLSQLRGQIAAWAALGARGIFVDEAGFDYWFAGEEVEMRRRQVDVCRHAHSLGLAVAFNAWNPDDVAEILSHDPEDGLDVPLGPGDALLYESYVFSSTQDNPRAGAGGGGTVSVRGETFDEYRRHLAALHRARARYGVEIWGCPTTALPADSFDPARWEFLVAAALTDGVDAVAWTTCEYSASGVDNAVLPFRALPAWAEAVGECLARGVGIRRHSRGLLEVPGAMALDHNTSRVQLYLPQSS
ncbi:hypothetical protein HDU96_002877 [Phlyctochytrium bullatum]|nr:hypothetical protein HDU96_002877 [Phlyctochytrium bullatum]